ncbi:SSD domain-containing protein [Aphelenchoides besseyi]|nr:SSD domain-containing protein [Aphelenchoides besseyi]
MGVKNAGVDGESASAGSVVSSIGSETKLIRVVHSAYKRWAYFIEKNAIAVIVFCTLLTGICTVKILTTPQKNDITGYTPYGARSLTELDVHNQFFDQNGVGIAVMVLAERKDAGNILNVQDLEEMAKIDNIVRNNFTIYNHQRKRNETFDEFCTNYCKLNDPLRSFYNGMQVQMKQRELGLPLNDRIHLDYPQIDLYGVNINVQASIYGVHFRNSTRSQKGEVAISNLKSAEMLALMYKAGRIGDWTADEIKKYEMDISNFFIERYHSSNLKLMTISTTYVETEIVRAGLTMLPFLLIGFIIMACISSFTVMLSAIYFRQVSYHKFSLAIFACICPFMASGTALGLMFFAGARFGSILCVTPFLVLAIGVDDAYLMIHAWSRVSKEFRENPSPEDSVANRLALVLVDCGPAIAISALTNILADAVGSFTGSPEVTLLCIGSMCSIFIDFIYQISFYSAIMTIVGKLEMRQETLESQQPRYKLSIPIGEMGLKEQPKRLEAAPRKRFCLEPSEKFHNKVKDRFERFVMSYVDFITNTVVASFICILWLLFIMHSIYWVTQFEVNLTTKKMFAADSPLLEIDYRRENKILPHYTVATIFVNHPGDLNDPERLREFYRMVAELESFPESWGPKSTILFLNDFLSFEHDGGVGVDEEAPEESSEVSIKPTAATSLVDLNRAHFDSDDLPYFLAWPEYDYWKGFIRIKTKNNHTTLESFFFQTTYHGDHLKKWSERSMMLQRWRRVIDRYPTFNASAYHEEGIFLDLIENMPTDAWQSALATLVCMTFVCFVFMYDTYSVLVSSAVIASIMTGMLGTLCWEGLSMDPIFMASLVISIGFSVDIPAHVAFHFHAAGYENPNATVRERLISTLSSVGFPAIQASISTNLVVVSLIFVPLYMAQVFVQIMLLCILLCVIHSLVILPAVFSLIERIRNLFKRRSAIQPSAKSTITEQQVAA